MTNPRNVNTLFGRNTDLSGWMMNAPEIQERVGNFLWWLAMPGKKNNYQRM